MHSRRPVEPARDVHRLILHLLLSLTHSASLLDCTNRQRYRVNFFIYSFQRQAFRSRQHRNMGMWYNYTLARNDGANLRCCPKGNNSDVGAWSFCAVDVGNGSDVSSTVGTKVNDCFVFKQNVSDFRLYLQAYPEHPPSPSAARRTTRPFGIIGYIVLALSLATFTLAAQDQGVSNSSNMVDSSQGSVTANNTTDQNQALNVYLDSKDRWEQEILKKYGNVLMTPMCTRFEPDEPESWDLAGEMPPIAVSGMGASSAGGAGGMSEGPQDGLHWYLNVTWRAEVPVTGNWTALEDAIRAALPADRVDRLRKEVYVPYVGDLFAWSGLPRSMTGQTAVSSSAVIIPGTYSDCVDKIEHTIRGNVSVPYWDGLFYFTALQPL